MDRITLQADNAIATLAPDVGGGIASLILAGHEILRREPSLPVAKRDPRDLGEFPMVPWVNRIANGHFTWRGRVINVAEGPGRDPQGLHGIAWRQPWSVLDQGEGAASLTMTWDGGAGWPFPFRVTRRFILAPSALTIEARLTNLGSEPMPAALGFHPYFSSRSATLRARTSSGWITDAAGLPTSLGLETVAARMQSGLLIDREQLDNCFAGWDGIAVMEWPTHSLTMRTDPAMQFLQVYAPAGGGYFCVEPQSALPDAFNRDAGSSGVCVLAPGAYLCANLHLTATPPAMPARI